MVLKYRRMSSMIHRFYVKNFASVRDGLDLDFRVPGTTPDLPRFRKSKACPNVRLPTVILLIGANGSGKTTLLRALRETSSFAADSFAYPADEGILGFRPFLSQKSNSEPTRIEIDFEAAWFSPNSEDPSLYRYTLEIHHEESLSSQSRRVKYEALHTFSTGRSRRLFERRNGKPVYVAKHLALRPGDERLASIPSNASIVSTLAKLSVEPFVTMAQDLRSIQSNIVGFEPWHPPDDLAVRHYQASPELVEKVSDILPRFDLGIKNMDIYRLQRGPTLKFDHHGLEVPVLLPFESSGTRHLVRMFPLFYSALETGSLAALDDFDVEFHADLAVEIMRWFQGEDRNPRGAQLICSSHNLSLLDDLEKEEVFIANKDRSGATYAYGIREVTGVRRSESLQQLYRSGTLGGLPAFG